MGREDDSLKCQLKVRFAWNLQCRFEIVVERLLAGLGCVDRIAVLQQRRWRLWRAEQPSKMSSKKCFTVLDIEEKWRTMMKTVPWEEFDEHSSMRASLLSLSGVTPCHARKL